MFLMSVQAFVQAFPASSEMLLNLTSNFDHWSAMEAAGSAAAAADAAAAGGTATAAIGGKGTAAAAATGGKGTAASTALAGASPLLGSTQRG